MHLVEYSEYYLVPYLCLHCVPCILSSIYGVLHRLQWLVTVYVPDSQAQVKCGVTYIR